eukprot:jgi/Undpi1/1463/HiC_scaffold_11.g04854.m2
MYKVLVGALVGVTRPVTKSHYEDDPVIDYCPHCYNARGPEHTRERAEELTDPAILDMYGGGEFPLLYTELAENGNYLEPEEIAVRHGVCGDPEQNAGEGSNTYSTPNREWEVLGSFQSGQVLEMDLIMNTNHMGHCEFFICNSADLDDPEGVATQECFNKHPLTRAPDDGSASPIDPNYPGRYYVDPECRADEIEQSKADDAPEGQNIRMRYVLPDIECEHCVLQMVYYTGNSCKHIGYDEFNPESWPSKCAPNKSDWIELDRGICGTENYPWGDVYPEQFWACSDISIS